MSNVVNLRPKEYFHIDEIEKILLQNCSYTLDSDSDIHSLINQFRQEHNLPESLCPGCNEETCICEE